MIYYSTMPSPLGEIWIAGSDAGISHINLPSQRQLPRGPHVGHGSWQLKRDAFADARTQLTEYFAGTRQTFSLPLAPAGTEFQQRVWQALQAIPYGTTCSYADIAAKLGKPKAVRAVGTANGQNPLPIVVPCHRVISSGGQLSGYAGGVGIKQSLLALEGALPAGVQAELL